MDKGLIPRRYAKALYETAETRGASDSLYAVMQQLAAAFTAEPALAAAIANPFVSDNDKISLLDTAIGNGEIALYADFLKLLAKNGRLDMAWDIARAFIELYRTSRGIYRVVVTSAAPMGDVEKRRLQTLVSQHIGTGTIEYDYMTDPSLIGGFTVKVNSELLDASVANRLKQLRLQLLG